METSNSSVSSDPSAVFRDRSDFEAAYTSHAAERFPSMHLLVKECRTEQGYGKDHPYLHGAWEGWKLRDLEVQNLKISLAQALRLESTLIRSHIISAVLGAVLCALFFIGATPNDHASRAEREFNACLDKAAPADSNAIQACKDAANSIHEIHAKQPSS